MSVQCVQHLVICCLDCIITVAAVDIKPNLQRVSDAEQAGLSLLTTVMIWFLDRQVLAKSVDPYQQSDQRLHCFPFCLHILDA